MAKRHVLSRTRWGRGPGPAAGSLAFDSESLDGFVDHGRGASEALALDRERWRPGPPPVVAAHWACRGRVRRPAACAHGAALPGPIA